MHHAKNLLQQVATFQAIAPQSVAASASVNGNVIDRMYYLSAVASCNLGAFVSSITGCTFKLQHGTLADGSNMADVSVIDPITSASGTLPAKTLTLTNTNGAFGCDLTSLNRYIRVVATVAAGGTSTMLSVDLILAGKNVEPPTGPGLQDAPYGQLN